MKVVIGSDHRGFSLKQDVMRALAEWGYEYEDVGCFDESSVDYPDVAEAVAQRVAQASEHVGVLICATGIGMSITANKVPGIRAALCADTLSARMARQHNDANLLCMGAEIIGSWLANEITKSFLSTGFEGGRHARRVEKIRDVERNNHALSDERPNRVPTH